MSQEALAASVITIIFFVGIIIIVVVWQVAATMRVKAAAARDEAYQKLAERVAATDESLAESGQVQAKSLAEISARLEAIEKLLRAVE